MKWHLVHIPKTGGQSMEAALGLPNCHESAFYIRRPRFAFVRHPMDRLVSAWEYGRKKGNLIHGNMTSAALREFFDTRHLLAQPMHFFLDAEVDFLGRFERMNEDWKHISDVPLPHLNASDHAPWQRYMDPECKAMAREFYARDFALYDYDPEG